MRAMVLEHPGQRLREVERLARRDGAEFLALAPRVPVRTEAGVFPLAQANEALTRLKGGSVRGAVVLRVDRPAAGG